MILSLYPCFQHWSAKGSVYLLSDTHFEDSDCILMDPDWIDPVDHVAYIKSVAHKNDTLVHLGDVGNPVWMKHIKAHKVLIRGNHDQAASKFEPYFDEVFTGPLMVGEKIILSHEPLPDINWAYNIHGHDHNPANKGDRYHLNLASNVVGFRVFSLSEIIKSGVLNGIDSIHRLTIDNATYKKSIRNRDKR